VYRFNEGFRLRRGQEIRVSSGGLNPRHPVPAGGVNLPPPGYDARCAGKVVAASVPGSGAQRQQGHLRRTEEAQR
jgi:hypothetical protein